MRSFFAKTLDGLGAEPDAEFAQRLDSQQRAGVTGEPERAIERVPGRTEPDEQRGHIGNDRQRQGQQ